MPYARKNYRRFKKGAKGRKKMSWYNRKYSALDAGKYALSQVWKLKGLVNSEMYKSDTVWTPAVMTQGFVSHRTAIAVGDTDSDRTGNSIFVRSINFKGQLTHNATGQNNQVVRLSLVLDTQQIGDTLPAYTDIYESSSPYAHLNSNTVGRFKILWTRTYVVNNYDKNLALVNMNAAMRHHVRYNGTASSDIQKGGLFMCGSCDEVGAAGTFPNIAGEFRLSYHDN